MIIEWFISLGVTFVVWMVSTFPDWSIPEWFTSADGAFATVVGMALGMGAWVDMGLMSTVVTAVVAVWGVSAVIKLILRAGSHVPGIGGSG